MAALSDETAYLSLAELSYRLGAGTLDAVAATRLHLDRATGPGAALNAFVQLDATGALRAAEAAAQRIAQGRRIGPLDGVPIAIKDNIDVAGLPTTNGIGGPHAPAAHDAEVTGLLRAAGAVILGKLNMEEAALGAVTDNPHFGRTHNPHRYGSTPGGSSGGSGAAVAAGLCAAALGSDTGGSIRIPAAYCGIVGLKPTFGLVPTAGVVPLAPRLDHVGPLTRTVADAAMMLTVLAPGVSGAFTPRARLEGVRLGVPQRLEEHGLESAVAAAFSVALDTLRRLGAEIVPVTLNDHDAKACRRALFVIVEAAAAEVHAQVLRREPMRLSQPLRAFLDFGRRLAPEQLQRAVAIGERAVAALGETLETVDALVLPTAPQAAFEFSARVPDNQSSLCVLANLAGTPALSVPMGLDAAGMPLGLQLVGRRGTDMALLSLGSAFEATVGPGPRPPAGWRR